MKLSVIIPNYNHGKYLPESLGSVLSQSYRADEIIVLDDCSKDNSIEIIEEYQKKTPEIILIRNEKNRGVHFSVNKALSIAKHEIIAILSADDLFFSDFFLNAMGLFDKNNDLGLVFSDRMVFYDKKPYQFIKNQSPVCDKSGIFSPTEFVELLRKSNLYVTHPCLYKREMLVRFRGLDATLLSLADYYIHAQIALRYPVGYIPMPLGAQRLLSTSYGSSVRFNFSKRIALLQTIMSILDNEDEEFKRRFIRSGLLSFNGYFMVLYLFLHPIYWKYFPFIFSKVIKRKFVK